MREHEQHLRAVLESALDGFYVVDTQGRLVEVNDAYCVMSGYTREELLRMRVADLESAESERDVVAHMQRIIRQGTDRFESCHRRKDGQIINIETSVKFLDSDGGQFFCSLRDITEKKRAEQALRESEEHFRLLVEGAPVGIAIQVDAIYRYVNPAALAMFGAETADQIVGHAVAERIHPHDRSAVDDRIRILKEGRSTVPVLEEQLFRLDGTVFDAEVNAKRFIFEGQEGSIVFFRDITDRKRAEEALRKSEEKYRRYFEQNLAGYCVTNVDGEFLVCNPAFLAMFGFRSMDEAAQVNVSSVYPSREARAVFLDMLKTKKHIDLHEMVLRRQDGSAIHIVQNAVGVFDEQGRLTEIHSYLMDDTKRWKIEQQFIQAQKMEAVGRLTAGIAHDFNNMLAVINGYSELLLEQIKREDSRYRSVEKIQMAGNRAAALTHQLLAFSRQQVLEPKVVDLNKIVSGSANLFSRVIGEDINLNVVLSPSPCAVKVDLTQIEQVIMNLAVNARDAMADGGQLTIETKSVTLDEENAAQHHPMTPGAYAMLTVSDTGTGMDAATRAHIFEPFFTTKELGKGTGLGLATVYGIVKQSGGYIWVYTELGRGTTFEVYLPLLKNAAGAEEVCEPSSQAEFWTETILLVEDDRSVREVIREMLTDVGYTVLEAGGSQEASKILEMQEKLVALLLTDVVMPGASGRLLADELVALQPAMKVLYMSGYTNDMFIRHGGLWPGWAFIQKPFSRNALTKKIRELLDQTSAPPAHDAPHPRKR